MLSIEVHITHIILKIQNLDFNESICDGIFQDHLCMLAKDCLYNNIQTVELYLQITKTKMQ